MMRRSLTPAAAAFSPRRVRAIVAKEFKHITRDWQTLTIVIIMPIVMMFLYGYALTTDMKDAPVLVLDPNPTPATRAVAQAVDASSLFKVVGTIYGAQNVQELFKKHNVKAIFMFDPDFSRDIRTPGKAGAITVFINGSDPNQGTIIQNSVEALLTNATLDFLRIERPSVVSVRRTILYNPQQKSAFYFVPGLMALILMLICAMLTALTITREKELGTMEQLLVSPLHPLEIILGKIIPYILLSLLDGSLILIVGRIAFGVTIAGNPALLALGVLIFTFCALALGLLFSTIAKTQQQALLIVMPVTLMPTMLLSGFIFPIASMPPFLQGIAYIIPGTYFLWILRGIILKGVGVSVLWLPFCVLALQALLFMAVSTKKFNTKL
ncbi:MAG: ABC transporter permease [Chitinivibrionales bacterium]|nr:ABC transporter permease [Chitinivibrionales bacterium]